MATSLARAGIGALTLVDPDTIEIHNLDAADTYTLADLGQPKVTAVAHAIHELGGPPTTTVHARLTTSRAVDAITRCDLFVTTVDNDDARWASGVIAALYQRPLLDIATGIPTADPARHGADIRLILPGDRCLRCLGGVATTAQTAARIPPAQEFDPDRWRATRAGSLRSVNLRACGTALGLLEETVTGRLRRSAWIRLAGPASEGGVERVESRPDPRCPLCALRGLADQGIPLLPTLTTGP